jgi:hypothetical protein
MQGRAIPAFGVALAFARSPDSADRSATCLDGVMSVGSQATNLGADVRNAP